MPYIPKKLVKLKDLDDLPIKKLANSPTIASNSALQDEWLEIQFALDQGAFSTTAQIDRAIERQAEIEAIMDERNL